ncbi:hypothetical protein [Ilumatobacter sp.]|uniref:hypothetical protein n=1 Tax=Ilumatobacter sp. TaxID=1967498 RepID=UPI003B526197
MLLSLDDASPGDVVGLVAVESDAGRAVEWLDRTAGTVHRLDLDGDAVPETTATIDVGTDGAQRGLLGQVVIDGRRFAAWTQPGSFDLVVGEITDDGSARIVWDVGPAGSGAIGGVLDEHDGSIVLGLGRNTAWDRESGVGGAIVAVDPDADPTQDPEALSVGYTNPWAFTVADDGAIWVADNAAGPDPADPDREDVERIGRADLVADRNAMTRSTVEQRAPSAMVELPDGRIGICGFLDGELLAYDVVGEARSELERAGTIMPCLTGAVVFADGTIVTAAQDDSGPTLHILRP